MKKQPIIVVAGPTATGKTAISISLAQQLGGEIISADSRQVYRGFDIGTAKATAKEQAAAPHHLLDIVDADQGFDVGQFVELARSTIADIAQRGRVPLVVGGTGLYLRALCGGLVQIAGRDEQLRQRLQSEAAQHGLARLHQRLERVDQISAQRIPTTDPVRIIRALEVFELTGTPLSEHQRQHRFADKPYRTLWLVLDQERKKLWQRIELRAEQMFASGLLEEALALQKRWGDITLLDTMGYREALDHSAGTCRLQDAIAQTAGRTRRYAKRQRTWFKREPVDHWLLRPQPETVLPLAEKFLRKSTAGPLESNRSEE